MNAHADPPWRRLDARIIWVAAAYCTGVMVAALAVLWWRDAPWWLSAPAPLVLTGIGYEALLWAKTRYRLTDEHIEMRTGVLLRRHRAIPRARVRSVELSANPLHRVFSLAVVKVETGHRTSSDQQAALTLNALPRSQAQALRAALVRRDGAGHEQVIALGQRRWLRLAPLTIATPALGLGALGATYQGLDMLGYDPDTVLIPRLIDWLGARPDLPALASLTALGLLLIGIAATLALATETWWNFRLVRESDGGLRATRGLFVTRSATLQEDRLHGVEIAEPLLLRTAGAACTYAVITGSGSAEEEMRAFNAAALLPPAPIAHAHRVAASVLREPGNPARTVRLLPHPRLALARRVRWALLAAAALGALLAALGAWLWPPLLTLAWITALAAGASGLLLARDAYRNLGHGLTGRYLVTRHGTLKRRTVALRRGGVIGWTFTQWAWHRRSTLCRLSATTPGGRGVYHVKDVFMGEGVRFAEQALPGLLTPFLTGPPATRPSAPAPPPAAG
ncbi:PH domain-containing protein [Nonomuraea sp. NPDC059023]|uniref:PH domain-containing protein n=1 Tax=unclassified Nonomuraea TaxID=2593643 RepID=UPI003673BD96